MAQVYLRALELDDIELLYKWHNDSSLFETLVGPYRYVSRATVEEWLRKKQSYSTQEISLAICLAENSQHIGNIYLRDIDWISRSGEVGIFIGNADQRSKGYGGAAMQLLKTYAFQELGFARLYLPVLADNKPAIRMYEKQGYVVEGHLRKHVYKNGRFKDVLIMGICSSDESTSLAP